MDYYSDEALLSGLGEQQFPPIEPRTFHGHWRGQSGLGDDPTSAMNQQFLQTAVALYSQLVQSGAASRYATQMTILKNTIRKSEGVKAYQMAANIARAVGVSVTPVGAGLTPGGLPSGAGASDGNFLGLPKIVWLGVLGIGGYILYRNYKKRN